MGFRSFLRRMIFAQPKSRPEFDPPKIDYEAEMTRGERAADEARKEFGRRSTIPMVRATSPGLPPLLRSLPTPREGESVEGYRLRTGAPGLTWVQWTRLCEAYGRPTHHKPNGIGIPAGLQRPGGGIGRAERLRRDDYGTPYVTDPAFASTLDAWSDPSPAPVNHSSPSHSGGGGDFGGAGASSSYSSDTSSSSSSDSGSSSSSSD